MRGAGEQRLVDGVPRRVPRLPSRAKPSSFGPHSRERRAFLCRGLTCRGPYSLRFLSHQEIIDSVNPVSAKPTRFFLAPHAPAIHAPFSRMCAVLSGQASGDSSDAPSRPHDPPHVWEARRRERRYAARAGGAFAHGVLIDIGISSPQLDGGRGFRPEFDGPLDMRFDISPGVEVSVREGAGCASFEASTPAGRRAGSAVHSLSRRSYLCTVTGACFAAGQG